MSNETISVSFMNSSSNQVDSDLTVPVGTTVGKLLDLNNVSRDGKSVSVRRGSERYKDDVAGNDFVLENNDFILVAPSSVKGA